MHWLLPTQSSLSIEDMYLFSVAVTNYHKFRSFKQYTFFYHTFCGSGVYVQLSWLLPLRSYKVAFKMSAEWCSGSLAEKKICF